MSTQINQEDILDKRATCLNCMDGRVQLPVIHWIKEHYNVDFVDVITEAGMDGVLCKQEDISEILRSIKVSVNVNKSNKIFVVGHYDCRGNPVAEDVHRQEIVEAVKRLKGYWSEFEIVGLWVNPQWVVEPICS
jgi:carbonic anhydrase